MYTVNATRSMSPLSVDQCLQLLAYRRVGRIGFLVDGQPQIYPLNYQLHEGSVVFRTGWGRLLDAVHNASVVFEVDGFDEEKFTGWSVAVRGQAEELWRPEDLAWARELPLHPAAPGERDHYVRIHPAAITGRRIS